MKCLLVTLLLLIWYWDCILGKPLLDYFQEIKNRQLLNENVIRFYAAELVAALDYLHEQDYVYRYKHKKNEIYQIEYSNFWLKNELKLRDFKPDDVLIDERGQFLSNNF